MQLLTQIVICVTLVEWASIANREYAMHHVIHTRISEGRRVVIPADICHEYNLEPGATVVLEPAASGIVLRPLDTVVEEVQAFFADAAPADVVLSEELSRDRRAEAEEEGRG